MSGGCVGVEALTAGSAVVLDGQLQTLLESWNPLDCLLCRQEFVQPVRLPCHHSFCRRCLADAVKCPACDRDIEGELEDDLMINFLIETSHESADVCANCDKVRDRLVQDLETDRRTREGDFNVQLKQSCAVLPSVHLYLLSASIFCASASKIDFLDSAHDLIKRIQNLTGDESRSTKPLFTGQLSSDRREEFAKALEPFLGLSSLLLSRGNGRCLDANGAECSGGTVSPRRCSRRSGSGYVNCPNALAMSKYQLIVDLAGAFGEEFARIETPVRVLAHLMSSLTKETQELQRDLTMRRCLIDKVRVNELIRQSICRRDQLANLYERVGSLLIGRFKEREEHVKLDIFRAYVALLRKTKLMLPTPVVLRSQDTYGAARPGDARPPDVNE